MSWALAAAGWLVAAVALVRLRRLRRVVADAEHELRGAVTVIALAAERSPRTRYADLERLQIDRISAALADLRAARAVWRQRRGRGGSGLRAGRVAQLLANLVANAAEHGVGPAEVATTRLPSGVRVEIRNHNRPREHRGPAASRDRGRGLAIAARAAREIGGSLSVASINGQTIATVELPAGESAGGPPAGERPLGERPPSERPPGERPPSERQVGARPGGARLTHGSAVPDSRRAA